jgi:hypothetical protein
MQSTILKKARVEGRIMIKAERSAPSRGSWGGLWGRGEGATQHYLGLLSPRPLLRLPLRSVTRSADTRCFLIGPPQAFLSLIPTRIHQMTHPIISTNICITLALSPA